MATWAVPDLGGLANALNGMVAGLGGKMGLSMAAPTLAPVPVGGGTIAAPVTVNLTFNSFVPASEEDVRRAARILVPAIADEQRRRGAPTI